MNKLSAQKLLFVKIFLSGPKALYAVTLENDM
jgi:hypothetical protein